MANQEQLVILKQGVDVWNQWIREQPTVIEQRIADIAWFEVREQRDNIELITFQLRPLVASELELPFDEKPSRRRETRTTAKSVPDPFQADLSGASLMAAQLSGSDFLLADLSRANLIRAEFVQANFISANLSDADLWRADLRGARLDGADLRNARLLATDLGGANLGKANLSHVLLKEAMLANVILWQANLNGADLTRAHLEDAILWDANLAAANLSGANLQGADLRGANLRSANLTGANLSGADLRGADLTDADLSKADLTEASLVEAVVEGATVSGSWVYGISVWDLKGEFKEQRDMILTPKKVPIITVDNIKVAQFLYLILNNQEIRDVINTLTSKSVLILGRFGPSERKAVLDGLKDKLRENRLLPIVFDFDRPMDRDYTETVQTLAGLSLFVIVDVTSPKSTPLEMEATVKQFKIPYVPIIDLSADPKPFAMLVDSQNSFHWVLQTFGYRSKEELLENIEVAIIKRALDKHNELRNQKATVQEMLTLDDLRKGKENR